MGSAEAQADMVGRARRPVAQAEESTSQRKNEKENLMKPDEVMIVREVTMESIEAVLREMLARAGELIEKYDLQPPISSRITDGHGKVILALDWDENMDPIRPAQFSLPEAAGFFCAIEDFQGKKVVLKVEIEGRNPVN
jgi:hypothetical protein